ANVADNNWHHVAVVYNGSSKILYVDGTMDAQKSFTQPVRNNNVLVRLGYNTEYPSGEYGGLLDDVRIFSRALSIVEIQQIQSEGNP
ncbi:MAG: LamG domain-containing protein, partial [Pseudomonadales bacterium]